MTEVELIRTHTEFAGRRSRPRECVVAALRDVAYMAAVFAWSIVGFCVFVVGVSVTTSVLALVVGVFIWVGFVQLSRWTTRVDRRLAGWQRGEPVRAYYRRPAGRRFLPTLRTMSSDPQTWRDLAWLAVNSLAGFVIGLGVITCVGLVLGYVSMPLWFWAVSDPASQYGVTNLGLFTVDTLGAAVRVTGLGLVLLPVVLVLARGAAGFHAALAARLLGASPAVARELLDERPSVG